MSVWLLLECQEWESSSVAGVYASEAGAKAAAAVLEAEWREDEYDVPMGVDATGLLLFERVETDKFCMIREYEVLP